MSKKSAFAQWQRLDQTSREAARAAVHAFKAYCQKHPDYRPVHAERFLSQRRFDGFTNAPANDGKVFDFSEIERLEQEHRKRNKQPEAA